LGAQGARISNRIKTIRRETMHAIKAIVSS
jgi:hypothetical protein